MKVKVQAVQKQTREVEVTLPLYIKHEFDGDAYTSVVYSRVTQGEHGRLTHVSVQKTDSYGSGRAHFEFEVTENFGFNPQNSEDYSLGKGEYACTPEEFNQAAREFLETATKYLAMS